jgi:divalent metal cation (Fe/Co/Zn/Cd) transporter
VLQLREAHEIAEQVEGAILRDVRAISAVQTHLEPLTEAERGTVVEEDHAEVERAVIAVTGRSPRSVRTLHTDTGLVVLLTLALDANTTLADAHDEASAVSKRVREALAGVADVVVHTEP